MASDNTYVTPPQLNFLANQLLPIEVPTNSQAELLRHLHGFTNVVSTEKPRPSLEYITQKRIFNEVFRDSQQRTQALIDQGFTEEAAFEHLVAYDADPLNRESDAIRSVAPVMEFLSPAGDVMAIADAVGQVLDGNVAGGLLGGGLATASIFFPGRVQGDAIADDMLRSMALQNASQGLVEDQVPDIIEYIGVPLQDKLALETPGQGPLEEVKDLDRT